MSQRPALFNLQLAQLPVYADEHVRWGDMDAYGHMNNTVFFRLFEAARMAYFEKIQFTDPKQNDGLAPILAHTECYFMKPLMYPQALYVGTRISQLQDDRFTMDYGLFIASEKPVLAACGSGKVVCYDYNKGSKSHIPERVAMRIRELENGDV
ncbi:MAG: acyl-CoA thioesterase [Gammaproteobacteria bacterium]